MGLPPINEWNSQGAYPGNAGSQYHSRRALQFFRTQEVLMGDATAVLQYDKDNTVGSVLVVGNYLEVDAQSTGASEILNLPPTSLKHDGAMLWIRNIGGEVISLQDSAGVAISDINPGGLVWNFMRAAATATWYSHTLEAGAAADLQAAIPKVVRVTAAALSGDIDVILQAKSRVIDAWCVHTAAAGAGDTIQVKNGANAITDAMDLNVADQTVVRAGTIDDAQHDIAAGGTLRITGASAVDAEVYVQIIEVP